VSERKRKRERERGEGGRPTGPRKRLAMVHFGRTVRRPVPFAVGLAVTDAD